MAERVARNRTAPERAVPDPAVDEELAALIERSGAMVEARLRSAPVNVLVSALALIVAVGPLVPGAPRLFGALTARQSMIAAAVSWCAFELAGVAHHVLGPRHGLARASSALETIVVRTTPFALIWLGGSAASPLWVASMTAAFVWHSRSPGRARLELGLLLASHGVLATAFFVAGESGDGWLTVLVLLASVLGHTLTARMAAHGDRVRAEREVIERRLRVAMLRQDRERMARELHDGVGADVMALVLRLRRAARCGGEPKAARRAERAAALLDDLRGVVWSLRNEQGTLAELGKLIDAACRTVRGGLAYERVTPLANAQEHIGPSAALATLAAASDLVRLGASRPRATKLRIELSVEESLVLTVEDDGVPLSSGEGERALAALRAASRPAAPTAARVDFVHLPQPSGTRIHARISLDELRPQT